MNRAYLHVLSNCLDTSFTGDRSENNIANEYNNWSFVFEMLRLQLTKDLITEWDLNSLQNKWCSSIHTHT